MGIYKTHNSTKSVTINPKKFAAKANVSGQGAASQGAVARAAPALMDSTNQMEGTMA